MKRSKLSVLTLATLLCFSFGTTDVDALAGKKCPKIGAKRSAKGVSYTCVKGTGRTGTWVASAPATTVPVVTTTVPIVTTASWACGDPFTDDQYPSWRLGELLLKPASRGRILYPKTTSCLVNVEWTPSNDSAVNKTRNVSICWQQWGDWPAAANVEVGCSDPYYLPSTGKLAIRMWTEHSPNLPYYGFYYFYVSGYLGDATKSSWDSPYHLAFYDIDRASMPADFRYFRLNSIKY